MSPAATAAQLAEWQRRANLSATRGHQETRDPVGFDLERLVLNGRKLDVRIRESLISGEIESTIEAASTLTLGVHDQGRRLVRAGLLDEGVLIEIGDHGYSLVQVAKTGDDYTLTFEDRLVAALREHKGFRKAYRDKVTRAEFIRSLVREEKRLPIRFYSPDFRERQPIEKASQRKSKAKKDDERDPGLSPNEALRGKEGVLSRSQLRNAERVMDVADSLKAPPRAVYAVLVACIVEAPDFRNPSGGEGSSVGILQLTAGKPNRMDIESVVSRFLKDGFTGRGGAIKLAKENPSMSPGTIAQAVQGSAFGSRYDQYMPQARAISAAYGGSSGKRGDTGRGDLQVAKRYPFSRGRRESTWDAAGRLAEEVGWRRFMVGGTFYFISEEDLIRSRARYKISEASDGVHWIDYDWARGKKAQEVTVHCRAGLFRAPPGTVMVVEDMGEQVDGRWLVSTIRRPLFTADTEITLKRPMRDKPEPAAETDSVSGSLRGTRGEKGSASGGAKGIVEQGARIGAKNGLQVTSGSRPGGITTSGNVSDHSGNDKNRAARDLSNGSSPTPQMDATAEEIAKTFGIEVDGKSAVVKTWNYKGYRLQMLYRTSVGGNHMNHVHFGAHRV